MRASSRPSRSVKVITCREGRKAWFFLIEGVLLKLAHVVLAASSRLVQGPQSKGDLLFGLQQGEIELHRAVPFRVQCDEIRCVFALPLYFIMIAL